MTQWVSLSVLYGVLIWSLCEINSVVSSCVFDEVKQTNVLKSSVSYGAGSHADSVLRRQERCAGNNGNQRSKREESVYKPIRIKTVFSFESYELTVKEEERLKTVVKEVVDKVANILSVFPVSGKLILSRSSEACHLSWQSGINKDKCAMEQSSYRGETCSTDNFLLPDDHMEGVYVWNHTHPDPVRVVRPQGRGLANTDFVLYVRSATTSACVKPGVNVIAYATYCQLDQNDRPIAGYLNFCPELVRDPNYDEQKLTKVALHELFHALGFAADLYDKFKKCTVTGGQLSCEPQPHVVNNVQGAMRLVTPKAVEFTSAHFNCQTHQTVNDFGPVLQTQNGVVKSHWDTAFMYGSIMAPVIGLPHQSLLDPVTLALFEDSGWYHVNYLHADMFIWGKGGGCDFGLNPSCEQSSEFFCSGSSKGCHYLHIDKGTCGTDSSLHSCRVFKSIPQDNCQNPANNPASHVINVMGELCGTNSRCFMSNMTKISGVEPMDWSGHCYQHRCNESGHLEVKVGKEPWLPCPFRQLIQVPNYTGSLQCPQEGVLCMEVPKSTTVPTQQPTSSARYPVHHDQSEIVCINIIFDFADYLSLEKMDLLSLFKDCAVQNVHSVTKVATRRLSATSLIQGSVIFEFNLHPAEFSDDGPPTEEALDKLEQAVTTGNFSFELPPSGPVYFAQRIIKIEGGPLVSDTQLSREAIAGAVVGALLAAAVIGLLMYLVQRHYTMQSQVSVTGQRPPHQEEGQRPPPSSRSLPATSGPSLHSRISPEDITHAFYAPSLRSKGQALPLVSSLRDTQTLSQTDPQPDCLLDSRVSSYQPGSQPSRRHSPGSSQYNTPLGDTGEDGMSDNRRNRRTYARDSLQQPVRSQSAVSTKDIDLDHRDSPV